MFEQDKNSKRHNLKRYLKCASAKKFLIKILGLDTKKKVFFDYLVSSGSPAGDHFKAIQIEHSGTLDTD